MRFDLDIAVELAKSRVLLINSAVADDLIGLVALLWKRLKVDRLEFVMAVRVRNVARGPQPKVQTIVFGDAAFVTVDDSGDFFRQRGRFRLQTKWRVVAHLVVRHAGKN